MRRGRLRRSSYRTNRFYKKTTQAIFGLEIGEDEKTIVKTSFQRGEYFQTYRKERTLLRDIERLIPTDCVNRKEYLFYRRVYYTLLIPLSRLLKWRPDRERLKYLEKVVYNQILLYRLRHGAEIRPTRLDFYRLSHASTWEAIATPTPR